jgi:hypothetical protein
MQVWTQEVMIRVLNQRLRLERFDQPLPTHELRCEDHCLLFGRPVVHGMCVVETVTDDVVGQVLVVRVVRCVSELAARRIRQQALRTSTMMRLPSWLYCSVRNQYRKCRLGRKTRNFSS